MTHTKVMTRPDQDEAQDQLGYRDASASQIEVVGAEQAQEAPPDIGDQRGLLVGLEQHEHARVVGQAAALLDLAPHTRGRSVIDVLIAYRRLIWGDG